MNSMAYPFWTPGSICEDEALNSAPFKSFIKSISSQFEPIALRLHRKNVRESKHGAIRSIFIRLGHDDDDLDERIHIEMDFNNSKQVYGSDTLFACELAHQFLKSLAAYPAQLHDECFQAQ